MGYFTIILMALGLSIDSFAVSISCGLETKILKLKNVIKPAIIFGISQGSMLIIGWAAGFSFKKIITGMDHWIAFILLLIIGLKMVIESGKQKTKKANQDLLSTSILVMLGIATSIDALAVGISLAFLDVPIINTTLIVGGITIIASSIGLVVGNKIGHFFEKGIQLFGGLVLIGIGIKILIEHLS